MFELCHLVTMSFKCIALLIFNEHLFQIAARQLRHAKHDSFDSPQSEATASRVVHPCELPSISDREKFARVCLQYYRMSFLCVPPSSGLHFSISDAKRIETTIGGQLVSCRVNSQPLQSSVVSIGNEFATWVTRYNLVRRKYTDGKQHHQISELSDNELDDLRQFGHSYADSLLMRPAVARPRFSLTVIENFDQVRLPPTPSSSANVARGCRGPFDRQAPVDEIDLYSFYAEEMRRRWSCGHCETDIAVLVLGVDPKFRHSHASNVMQQLGGDLLYAKNRRKTVAIAMAFSARVDHLMGLDMRNLTEHFNSKHAPYDERFYEDHLGPFIEAMLEIVRRRIPVWGPGDHRYIYHTIPRWAQAALCCCLLVGFFAAYIGHWVTSTRGSRSSHGGGKVASKGKWKAGFSGGMWGNKNG